ncbi:MAG TPA: SMP-30/gluconolactonase/LRE family protein [Planctomycetota bacterium]|nr:SMP-30/gluconolactonase/LRE family protein [Planctomycetota bacterium]
MRRLAWALVLVAGCAKTTTPAGPAVQSIGGPGSEEGRFATPRAEAWDPRGFLYVVDKTARIQKFDADGRYLKGWSTPASEKGRPTGLLVDSKGEIWVADTHYHRVLHYSPDGDLLSEFGTEGTGPGQLLYPTGLAIGPDGSIYVSEYGGNDRIQVFTREGVVIRSFGSYGPEPGQFERPQAIAIAGDRIYVADAANHRIQVFTLAGKHLAAWGDLKYPYSVSFDTDGRLLVAEYGRHRVSKYTVDGTLVATAGQPGVGPADLNTPWAAIAIAGGRIAVVDSGNHRVQLWPSSLLRGHP